LKKEGVDFLESDEEIYAFDIINEQKRLQMLDYSANQN
jgi:hypothetical protein